MPSYLREPVDGRARGLGARPAGARQRPVRRAARGNASAATPGCTTRVTRSSSETLYSLESTGPLHAPARTERPRVLHASLHVAGDRAEVPGHVPAAGARRRRGAARPAARLVRAAAARAAAGDRGPRSHTGRRRHARPRGEAGQIGMTVRPRVHQVLATLGYGDAIGHEVLGMQRVLRGAGYESEIIVETADPPARGLHDRLSRNGRRRSRQTTSSSTIFRIGSRASRTAFALPGRMVLVYHNITPPQYFVGVHRELVKQCFHGRRELTAVHRPIGPRARRLRIQPPGARGARIPADRRAAGRSRLQPPRRRAEPAACVRLRRRVDERAVCRPRDSEQEVRDHHPGVPRLSVRATIHARGCCSPAPTAGSRRYLSHAAGAHRRPGHARRALPRARVERGADGALRRRGSLPVRERARRLLRADHRSVLQGRARPGLRVDGGARDDGWRRRAL